MRGRRRSLGSIVGPGGDTTDVGAGICGTNNGCVGVFIHRPSDDAGGFRDGNLVNHRTAAARRSKAIDVSRKPVGDIHHRRYVATGTQITTLREPRLWTAKRP